MRVAGRIAAQALQAGGAAVAPGVTTDEVDRVVHEFLVDHDAYPSTLGYRGFPKSCCTSLNEVICHGIPDSTVIQDGDIVNIDVTAFVGGVHGDTNATFIAGDAAEEDRLLVERTHEATMRAIKAVRPGPGAERRRAGHRELRPPVRLRRGARLHRPRHRPRLPLRPRGAALRRPGGDHGARGGDDLHHRADDHPRHRRLRHVGRRLDGADEGPEAHGAVRAHDRRHRAAEPRSSPCPEPSPFLPRHARPITRRSPSWPRSTTASTPTWRPGSSGSRCSSWRRRRSPRTGWSTSHRRAPAARSGSSTRTRSPTSTSREAASRPSRTSGRTAGSA